MCDGLDSSKDKKEDAWLFKTLLLWYKTLLYIDASHVTLVFKGQKSETQSASDITVSTRRSIRPVLKIA